METHTAPAKRGSRAIGGSWERDCLRAAAARLRARSGLSPKPHTLRAVGVLAATNKCLTRINKSSVRARATKKAGEARPYRRRGEVRRIMTEKSRAALGRIAEWAGVSLHDVCREMLNIVAEHVAVER
jgi:hypothetical protein